MNYEKLRQSFLEVIAPRIYEYETYKKGASITHPDEWIGEYLKDGANLPKDKVMINTFNYVVDGIVAELLTEVQKASEENHER